jgi:hypothetical protein
MVIFTFVKTHLITTARFRANLKPVPRKQKTQAQSHSPHGPNIKYQISNSKYQKNKVMCWKMNTLRVHLYDM